MKRLLFTLTTILFCVVVFAQSPEKMSYQSVVRDTKGNLVKNTTIGLQISILQGDINGTVVYTETQLPVTNANGLATLVIGEGKTVSGSISSIDWSNGPYFIKTETDISGGTNYTITGTSQLLSVPYAMHSTTAESLTNPVEEADPVFSSWDKSSGIAISESQVTDLKHFTNADEADPQYSADSAFIKAGTRGWNSSLAKTIGTEDTTRWGKTFTETDPLFTAWDKSTGVAISESQITDLKHFTNDDETDPLFIQSTASGITPSDTARWNDKSSFSGNYQDLTNKPTGLSDFTNDMDFVQSYELNKYLTAESDPKYTSDSSFIKTGVRSWNHSLAKKINTADTTRWGKAETDPLFSGSQAANLTATDIIHLGNLSGTNTGDQDLSGLATKTALGDTAAQLHSETATNLQAIIDTAANIRADMLTGESDPYFTSSVASGITVIDTANWNIDTSATNELQVISISNDTIYLEKGNYAVLPTFSEMLAINDSANSQIKNVSIPTDSLDAVNKAYNDSMIIKFGSTSRLLTAGYSVEILLAYGHTVPELLTAGASVSELLTAGISVSQLIAVGVSVPDLVAAGATTASDYIGLFYQGGLIFSINTSNGTGLECTISDAGNYTWNEAVSYCNNLTMYDYDDWYLPSLTELYSIYNNLFKKGLTTYGTRHYYYWSSTESSDSKALALLITGISGVWDKSVVFSVRAVRAF